MGISETTHYVADNTTKYSARNLQDTFLKLK